MYHCIKHQYCNSNHNVHMHANFRFAFVVRRRRRRMIDGLCYTFLELVQLLIFISPKHTPQQPTSIYLATLSPFHFHLNVALCVHDHVWLAILFYILKWMYTNSVCYVRMRKEGLCPFRKGLGVRRWWWLKAFLNKADSYTQFKFCLCVCVFWKSRQCAAGWWKAI